MDCLRTAVRLGFQDVRCLYRRGEKEMPGRAEDKQHALEEGVRFNYFVAPVEFLGTDRVQAVRCLRTRPSEPDDTGRPRPVPIPGSEFDIPVDTLVLALGFDVRDEPARSAGLTLRRGRIPVDANLATTRPGLFAAGDAHHGPDLIVTAVNDARRAAAAIDQYLQQRPKPGAPT